MIQLIDFDGTVKDVKDGWSVDTIVAIARDNRFVQKVVVDGEIIFSKSVDKRINS